MSLVVAIPPNRPDLLPDALHLQAHDLLPPHCPILVPIAVDELTSATLQVARTLAMNRDVVPTLLYVVELPPYVTVGQSAASIVSHARQLGAKCIVMGLHHHNVVGRPLGADTLREVMALGGVPVMAVLSSLTALPKSVVVAMDFSRASIRAARLAREIMDVRGTLHLVFVDPTSAALVAESDEGQRLIQTNGVTAAFEQVIATLDPVPGMTINTVQRSGVPIPELIAVCEQLQPELVAVGSQCHPFLQRQRLDSVATGLVTEGRWSMLITPPAYAPTPGNESSQRENVRHFLTRF